MKTEAIFFDVGGTLLRPWPGVGAVYATVAARHGIAGKPADLEASFGRAWRELKSTEGLTTTRKAWWRQLVFATVPGATAAYFEDLYGAFARAETWRVYDDVAGAVADARKRGRHVGVISNWDERLRPLLAAVGLTGWDSITVSCEVGAEKPAAAIFRAALRTAGVAAAAAVHVGDSYHEDVTGAVAVGMRAVLVQRGGGGPHGCHTVADLREIGELFP